MSALPSPLPRRRFGVVASVASVLAATALASTLVALVAGCGGKSVAPAGAVAPAASSASSAASASSGAPGSASEARAWVVVGAGGALVIRAVGHGASCPALEVDGAKLAMSVRAAPDAAYADATCEASLPAAARAASIEGRALAIPKPRIDRIVVLGDTGCRMKEKTFQDCNDPKAWPFAKIAGAAAAWKPDLVIHVGDFLYRKTECPDGNAGCAGSPVGDRETTWDADFVAPALPLLRAAPWIVVRGNHEGCSAGGVGFFRLLDPRPLAATCTDTTAAYATGLGDLRFWVLDSVVADDVETKPEKVELFRAQLASLEAASISAKDAKDAKGAKSAPAWLLVHRPLFGVFGNPRGAPPPKDPKIVPINATLQAAWGAAAPKSVDLVLSGHVHMFQAISFAGGDGGRPAQLVAGMGGTLGDVPPTERLDGVIEAGTPIAKGVARAQPGFVTLERKGARWEATLRDPEGAALVTCTLDGRTLACAP
jgi:predicted phosphodiesterase